MNKWKHTEKAYEHEFARFESTTADSNRDINYDLLLTNIIGDLHMVDISRKVASDEATFIDFAYRYFPIDSEAFAWAHKVVGLKYICNYKNEFIACYKRGDDPKNIIYIPRAEAEYNPKYVQIVAMAIPFIRLPDGGIVYIFVEENKSDMIGHTTMIGGHVQYKYNSSSEYLESMMIGTAKREALEELGLDTHRFTNAGDPLQYTPDIHTGSEILGGQIYENPNDDICSISKYHRGTSYTFEISQEALQKIKIEEGKRILFWASNKTYAQNCPAAKHMWKTTISNIEECLTHSCAIINPDPWLKKFMESVNHD